MYSDYEWQGILEWQLKHIKWYKFKRIKYLKKRIKIYRDEKDK